MGSCTSIEKCPKCGFYDEKKGEGLIVDTYTNGEEYVSCKNPECDYGYKIIWVPICLRCGTNILNLLPKTSELWMITGVKACPICNSPFIHWNLELYKGKVNFIKIPLKNLHSISELLLQLRKPTTRKTKED